MLQIHLIRNGLYVIILAVVILTVLSKNGVKIRLTQERWRHIITSHLEINSQDFKSVISVIEDPDFILQGDLDELLAIKKKDGSKSWFVVPYKEVSGSDGFILTAYLTTGIRWLFQRKVIWSKE